VQLTELPAIPEPLPERKPVTEVALVDPEEPTGLAYDWYWTLVSSRLDDAGPVRVSRALDVLALKPEDAPLRVPRLQSLQNIADMYGADILMATVGTRVSPALALAMISIESSGKPAAISTAGATGLMQLMPATAERFGITDSTNPSANIRGGVAYMDWLLKEFGGDAVMALAGYNAGENAVKKHGGVPPYSETRAYVPKVLAAWQVARGLCMSPPQFITDPCVFVGPRTASNG
jgi:soluble lytic murein transglycosylase-like protein